MQLVRTCASCSCVPRLRKLENPLRQRLATPVRFRIDRSWMPSFETIDEADRRKRVMISMRFEDADKDKNGRIDMQELKSLLESACCDSVEGHLMQHWLSDAEVGRLMTLYDTDHSGDLSMEEFQKLVNDGLMLDEKLSDYQAAFAAVDTDGSGDISSAELALALQGMGWPEREATEEKAQQMMARYGLNARGCLDFSSFMCLIKDVMLDVQEVLAYLGAHPESPATTRAVIHAVAHEQFSLIMSTEDLQSALLRAGDKLVLLMAGTTWCSSSRAMVTEVKKLANAYPEVVVLMLWGNVNAATKDLFRDQLLVRSTPAFFMFRGGDLVCHWAGGDPVRLETEIRRRLPADSDMPAAPMYAAH